MTVQHSLSNDQMSKDCLDFFKEYAQDAGNWGGSPLVGGNIPTTPQDKGYITDLKKKGYINTWQETKALIWMEFTEKGKELAAIFGIEIE